MTCYNINFSLLPCPEIPTNIMQSTLQEKHVIKQKYTSPFSNFDMYDKKDNTEHNAD